MHKFTHYLESASIINKFPVWGMKLLVIDNTFIIL